MIEIKELRIGNYVLANGTAGKIFFIGTGEEGQKGSIGIETENNFESISSNSLQIEGLPLEDGLLEQFGFHFHPHFKLWQRAKDQNSFSIELDRDYSALDFSHRPIIKNIKFMHTLQNLFYMIQGDELQKTINISHKNMC